MQKLWKSDIPHPLFHLSRMKRDKKGRGQLKITHTNGMSSNVTMAAIIDNKESSVGWNSLCAEFMRLKKSELINK